MPGGNVDAAIALSGQKFHARLSNEIYKSGYYAPAALKLAEE
jgi:hypothetical protein